MLKQSDVDTLISATKAIYYTSPDSSMILSREIVRLSDELSYDNGRLEGLRWIGNSHFLLGRLDSAANYMLRLLDLAYETENLGMQADVMIDIGQTYDKIGMQSLALDYFKQAHEIRLQIGDPERLSVTFINLAYHYFLRDQFDSALHYYRQTEIILDTIPLTYTTPFLYNEIGGVYLKQGRLEEAREKIQKAIVLNKQLKNNWDLSFNYVTFAQLELQLGNDKTAEEYALKALEISDASNISLEYDIIFEILSETKARQGLNKEALDYLRRSNAYADSLDLALKDQKILALDHYKRQKENLIGTLKLVNENQSQNAKISRQRYLLISIALVLIVTLGAVGILYRQNKQLSSAQKKIKDQNEDLKNLNTTKTKLFSIVTHDLRNPLSQLNGMLKLTRDGYLTHEEFHKYIGSMVDQTDRMTEQTETLMNWSKSQQSGLVANPQKIDLNQLIAESMRSVMPMAEGKQIRLHHAAKNAPGGLLLDPHMMTIVLNNLLTNAIKFTPVGGEVMINTTCHKKEIAIHISDSGVGIPENLIEDLKRGKIKSRPGTENEKGSGIGLTLTLDLISLNGGRLCAENNSTKGSTFRVTLPSSS